MVGHRENMGLRGGVSQVFTALKESGHNEYQPAFTPLTEYQPRCARQSYSMGLKVSAMSETPIKLFSTISERYPEPDETDRALALARGVIGAAPLGGSLLELLSPIIGPPVERRRQVWPGIWLTWWSQSESGSKNSQAMMSLSRL